MKKKIGIIGLGFVGLPLLVLLNKLKYIVYGFDINIEKIESLKKNISYNSDITSNELKQVKKNNIYSMNSISEIKNCDYIIICLPTPLHKNQPDMRYIIKAFNTMYKFLRKNQTLILESSVYPGATKDIFLKKLSKKFLVGKNFYLGYSPERIDPGQKNLTPYELAEIVRPSVVGLLIQQLAPLNQALPIITFSGNLEQMILNIANQSGENGLILEPSLVQRIVSSINDAIEKLQNENKKPVLITAPVIRKDISLMLRQHIDNIDVLSFTELPDDKKIDVVATINLDQEEKN